MSGRRDKMIRRTMSKMLEGNLRANWAALASLKLRDRVRLAWWMLIGKKQLPAKGV